MKMISQLPYIMTLANSIIGVSVLAMPFCFKQCGIVLAALVLLLSSVLSRLACHFLVKSAVMSRRRNFELLAFHAMGHMGKFFVELFIIGFLVGTCIAFFVVMGDLGPQIVGKMLDKNPEDIRTSLLVTTSVFIVLPLGLLRNIDSLSSVCTATIVFYLCLVLKIISESMQHIFAGDWYEHVYYWRPSGILQCIPIFSMALFCQTQLFEIYETIPNVSLEKMNEVVRGALNICTIVYLCVGFFGYIAFCTQPFTGNILMSLEPSVSSEMMKMGFVFSVAFSFPLVIFPCRASLNSLLFRRVYTHEPSINYLPEARFRYLTITIVAISLITGILMPNIEFVLGLVGSTIGVMICLIFPAIFFISISSKHTNERLIAQAILFIGICIMILSTYANLYAMEESSAKALATTSKPLSQINNLPLNLNKDDIRVIANIPNNPDIIPDIKEEINKLPSVNLLGKSLEVNVKDIRQEPPIPVERIVVTKKPAVETQKSVPNIVGTFGPEIKEIVEKIKTLDEDLNKESKPIAKVDTMKVVETITVKAEDKINVIEPKEKSVDTQKNDNLINSDAINKEESELAADAEADSMLAAERHEKLRKTLEKHKLEQLEMMQEQKKILKDIKEQKKEIEREKHRIAKDAEEFKEGEQKSKMVDPESIAKESDKKFLNFNDISDGDLTNGVNQNINKKDPDGVKLDQQIDKTHGDIKMETGILTNEAALKDNPQIEGTDSQQNFIKEQDASNTGILSNPLINEKIIDNPEPKLSNARELPKGPILNALTKRTLQKSDTPNDIPNNSIADGSEKLDLKTEERKLQDQYSLPIALKMRNQTKIDNASAQLSNKSEENIQVIRRDILENHQREKRDLNETNVKATRDPFDGKIESIARNSTGNKDQENCFNSREDIEEKLLLKSKQEPEKSLPKVDTTEVSLIKTNAYLSDQEFINSISVNPNIAVRGEYAKAKQRDLKAVDVGAHSET